MKRTLIVFAGRSKCGKTTLAERLSKERSLSLSSFGEAVRRAASDRYPGVEQTLELLQDVGESLVTKDPGAFCREVCGSQESLRKRCVVVDGLRHKSLLPHLRALHPKLTVVVVYVEASDQTRRKRFTPPLTDHELYKHDGHIVEAEEDALREAADLVLSTDQLESKTYKQLCSWLSSKRYCVPKHKVQGEPQVTLVLGRALLVASFFWAAFAMIYLHSAASHTWRTAADQEKWWNYQLSDDQLLPLQCDHVLGAESIDFFRYKGSCWMSLTTFRKLYPELKDKTDSVLIQEKYGSSSLVLNRPSRLSTSIHYGVAILVVPMLLFLVWISGSWIFSGLRAATFWRN